MKPWWKTFLTPGWVIAAVLIVAFSYFAFTFLAPWQLGKNERLVARNEHIVEAFENDPVPLSTVVAGGYDPADEWTRVTATGQFTSSEVLLRFRPVDRTPAFQVLTPFELDSGGAVLVNRGWVPAEESTRVPDLPAPPSGTVTITGFLLNDEGLHPTQPNTVQGHQMVYSISPAQVAELVGDSGSGSAAGMLEPYIQLTSDSPGVITAIPLPQLETGNHLSYGLQWIAFGILAPAGLLYFIFAETRERRRYREEQEELAAGTAASTATPASAAATASVDSNTATEPATASAPATSTPTRSRYGQSRRNPWARSDQERGR